MLKNKLTRLSNKVHVLSTLLFAVSIGLSSLSALSQSSGGLAQITQLELDALGEGARTQQQIEELDDRRVAAANQYRAVLKQNTNLKKYNDLLIVTIQSQQKEMSSIREQIGRISHLERDIVPLMSEMLDALGKFIALDIPFLIEERLQRLQKLQALFADGNVSNAEKYRRILEAYQIENDYGRTIETYEGFIEPKNSNEKQHVQFLKIGRIAYLYQTNDSNHSFRWSDEQHSWLALSSRFNDQISEGIKMAKEQIPSNLMFVPIVKPTSITRF